MSRPSLGKYVDGTSAIVDLPKLLETRMLIQAASGFGKSYAVRRLLEQTAGHVQQFVIDPDGEFATLREKHDFIIAAAHDGEDVWQMAGWSWEQDVFTAGHGKPKKWMPFPNAPGVTV